MTTPETIPFPALTGNAERDIVDLHEYVFKLQEIFTFNINLLKREIEKIKGEQ